MLASRLSTKSKEKTFLLFTLVSVTGSFPKVSCPLSNYFSGSPQPPEHTWFLLQLETLMLSQGVGLNTKEIEASVFSTQKHLVN